MKRPSKTYFQPKYLSIQTGNSEITTINILLPLHTFIWFLSLWVVTAICKAPMEDIFTVPVIVELAGS